MHVFMWLFMPQKLYFHHIFNHNLTSTISINLELSPLIWHVPLSNNNKGRKQIVHNDRDECHSLC